MWESTASGTNSYTCTNTYTSDRVYTYDWGSVRPMGAPLKVKKKPKPKTVFMFDIKSLDI